MRYLIIIGLLAFTLVGCAASKRETALRVWRSPDSTPKQRANAVSELVPIGASKQSVQSVLGTNGSWTHFYGPNLYLISGPSPKLPSPYHDFWCLVYEYPDGGVQLFFDPPTAFGDRFVRVRSFNVPTNMPPNKSPEPTAVGPFSSAFAVHVVGRRWLSFLR
jgi:hypothetical protein